MATCSSVFFGVVMRASCAQAAVAVCACHPTSSEPRTGNDSSPSAATAPASGTVVPESSRATASPSPAAAASGDVPAASLAPTAVAAASWRIDNDQYLVSPQSEDPPPLERCGV